MPHRVLVVEDDVEIRDSLIEVLAEAGYTGVAASNGEEAFAALSNGAGPPCLILLDLMMPQMDGQAFRQRQLDDPALASIPVVVISAYRDVAAIARALAVQHHLRKPLDLDELLAITRHYCPGDPAQAAAAP